LLAALLPGLGLTSIFFLIPDLLTRTIFGDAYASLGIVVGLVGLATTLYAGINIWLNYALSVKRPLFIYTLVFVLALQTGSMFFLADDLTTIASIMVAGGFLGNLAGALFTLRIR
ncbi:MAG: hypothetical protein KC413_06210, partial [Anaerolineales bacterium]|nr:hypothetical protein [Anaerolineales bacterium]